MSAMDAAVEVTEAVALLFLEVTEKLLGDTDLLRPVVVVVVVYWEALSGPPRPDLLPVMFFDIKPYVRYDLGQLLVQTIMIVF